MWFDDELISDKLIKPILESRPLIEAYYKSDAYLKSKGKIRSLLTPKFSHLHFVYSVSFDSIKENFKLPSKPISQRILERDENGPIAFHTLSLDQNKPQLLDSMVTEKRINDFFAAVNKIKEKVKDETKGKIRYLSIRSLNVKSVWLHLDESGNDGFSLMTRFDPKQEELMEEKKYRKYLVDSKNRIEGFKNIVGGLDDEKAGG